MSRQQRPAYNVVDTPTYWSTFGELVILGLIQVGGIGIMTLATLLALVIARRIGLRMQLTAQAETKSLGLGDVRHVVGGILALSLAIELVVAVPLTARFALAYGEPPGRAVYLGMFHAVSAFNNAGFALFTDNMIPFAPDPWICLPIVLAVVLGGIGFPVLFELGRRIRTGTRRWSLHVRITVVTYGLLLVVAVAAFLITEWCNPATTDDVLFEVVSAFGTVGLSTGITDDLPAAGQLVLVALMFLGRLGPITLASALALRDRVRRYERPEERPIVG